MDNVDYLSVAVDIAREAGALLLKHYQRVEIEYKGEFNLVTAADRAAEALIIERLHNRFPTHSIIAEEGGGSDKWRLVLCSVEVCHGSHSNPANGVNIAGRTFPGLPWS